MSRAPEERLQRLLGGEDLARLRRRLRRHFERAVLDAPAGILRLGEVSACEYQALASLMGRPPRQASSIQVDIAAIDTGLSRAGIAPSLRAALECLDGPIVHLPTARAAALARWAAVAGGARHPGLAQVLSTARGLGLLKRLSRQNAETAARIGTAADLVLHRLPVLGLPRAQLAAEVLGDAHALDSGQPAATLVLSVLRQDAPSPVIPEARAAANPPPCGEGGTSGRRRAFGPTCRVGVSETGEPRRTPTPSPSPHVSGAPSARRGGERSAAVVRGSFHPLRVGEVDGQLSGTSGGELVDEDDRALWARAGVLVNELARPALFLNLPMEGGGTFAGEAGEPAYATLRRLLRWPPRLAVAGRTVHVCENPNLVAIAADGLGERCAPIVCTDGMPAAAQRTLLLQLAEAEANLSYHGDFDWPGIRIANLVMRSFGAQPWRLGAADYTSSAGATPGQTLAGPPVAAAWDTALAPAMQKRGLAIPEEAVAATLLHDLQL